MDLDFSNCIQANLTLEQTLGEYRSYSDDDISTLSASLASYQSFRVALSRLMGWQFIRTLTLATDSVVVTRVSALKTYFNEFPYSDALDGVLKMAFFLSKLRILYANDLAASLSTNTDPSFAETLLANIAASIKHPPNASVSDYNASNNIYLHMSAATTTTTANTILSLNWIVLNLTGKSAIDFVAPRFEWPSSSLALGSPSSKQLGLTGPSLSLSVPPANTASTSTSTSKATGNLYLANILGGFSVNGGLG